MNYRTDRNLIQNNIVSLNYLVSTPGITNSLLNGEMEYKKIIELFKAKNISVKEFQITINDLYIDNSKDFIIKKFLIENFEIGTKKDFVKLNDIKKLLKNTNELNNKDLLPLVDIIHNTFNDAEFKKNSSINNISIRNFFTKLKIKTLSN